ncbi:SH3 domain-containing protein [Ectothiorhodospiraceae bacterium BW-2]|nr:SH3 domain-containing protein [Ectothiorhodospiraceae bacterium BW-2]
MMTMRLHTLLAALTLSATLQAETGYIQSQQAPLFAQPAFNANKIATLNRGDEVTVVSRQTAWIEVTSGSQQGWLSKFMFTSHPPLNNLSPLDQSSVDLNQSARTRASVVTTAGAARGLSADSEEETDRPANYDDLQQMEQLKLDAAEYQQFIDQIQHGK